MEIHRVAAIGFASSVDAYERGRPSYPVEAIKLLVGEVGAGGARVLDIGAGTGKLTRLIAPHARAVVALEPVEAMRNALVAALPSVRAVAGAAESIPLEDGSFEVAVAAQAFHWFGGDRALAEIHRVLTPGGRVALVWNVRDESVPWVRETTTVLEGESGGAPTYRSGEWRRPFERSRLFGPLSCREVPFEHEHDEASFRDRFASISYIAARPEAERNAIVGAIVNLARAHDPARLVIPYQTHVYWCTRLP
jgi:SAM-dependent methyltransferase